ncbi:hypothetical protein K461DRAFT_230953 [Myriangium duriaei CBS 260.36]|uniref:Copper transport protein n=1 Tax=Myriangium duriaei CBS 260.36 TaxID=1168546 RepID=A0A9P4IXH5_9PEZI|nr:hypothetical protein K461DRAFT_230953 [Myriangium duriaei CBS 260.36]
MASMGSMSMQMYFTTSTTTPLWSARWTPSSTGTYAGTCVFLIVFALISRLVGAARQRLEQKWHDDALNRRYVVVADKDGGEGQFSSSQIKGESETGVLTARGIDETVRVIKTKSRSKERTPFRLSVDLPRSMVYIVQAGMGYLLMLAVMTFNVGYFMSVLGGLFLGELAVGRFTSHGGDH